MSDYPQYFHLTLGPVQGFVVQARRTRDFWAGSFLLSWLSSVAMLSVEKQDGEVQFPEPDKAFLDALMGEIENGPEQGSVPNRFKALGAKVGQDFSPERVVEAMQSAWRGLCMQVWKEDMIPALTGWEDGDQLDRTRAIWDRQINHYWDISWCLTDDPDASNLLDRRKNWRSHCLPPEPGTKCMMMEGFQELSGETRPNAKTLGAFWNHVRSKIHRGTTDLRQGECLSALGLVKRRFVRHFHELELPVEDGITVHGWPLKSQVPSVLYMAAAPWYGAALVKAKTNGSVRQALFDFHDAAEQLTGFPEAARPLRSVEKAANSLGLNREYAGLDGGVFHRSHLEQSARHFENPDAATQTLQALNGLRRAAQLSEPSSFYAVLIMDGDSLGSQVSDSDKQMGISDALKAFTAGVLPLVNEYDGFLIYAGGDDVLALVSLGQAIELALALRTFYDDCFKEQNKSLGPKAQIGTSLSGGIEFCHIKTALTFVLGDAHSLLDDVAKNRTGRDTLAIRVWKPGGLHLEWAQPWEHLLSAADSGPDSNLLSQVVRLFHDREQQSPFTNRFIFKVGQRLQRLPGDLLNTEDAAGKSLLQTLLTAELAHSGLDVADQEEDGRLAAINVLIEPLLRLATQYQRQAASDSTGHRISTAGVFNPDALKLVRFLTKESV